MLARTEIDCSRPTWNLIFEYAAQMGREADLINFDFNTHGEICVSLARRYGLEFRLSREAGTKEAMLRNTDWK